MPHPAIPGHSVALGARFEVPEGSKGHSLEAGSLRETIPVLLMLPRVVAALTLVETMRDA